MTSKVANTDIDIDVPDRNKIVALFGGTPAAIHRNGKKSRHNTGVYFHDVPKDPFTGICTLDHKEADAVGYIKIDVLNVSIYNGVRDQAHMDKLLSTEPMWELLSDKEFCNMLFQLNGHHDVCRVMKPSSIIQLAAVLAMIRPAKRYLIGKDWETVMKEVWVKPSDDGYYFKKSHSLGYAHAVVVHMNLITEKFSSSS